MSGYTKLFNSILASTIWRADDKTRLVWITMLAMADKHGHVAASVPGLADFARVSLPDCQKALAELESPDEWSRSKEHDGRRIEVVDGGWDLLNHGKYREKMNADERREYLKLKQREYRSRKQVSTFVNNVSDTDTVLTHASPEAEAEAEAAPSPKADPNLKNKQVRKVEAAIKAANGNGGADARSKHPIFKGNRFIVFDWQLEDIGRLLGPHLDTFDLHVFFDMLDQRAVQSGELIPQRDRGDWLQAQIVAEAKIRGLKLAASRPAQRLTQDADAMNAGVLALLKADGTIK